MNTHSGIDAFVQASRILKITSPLGDDILLPERATVTEGVSELFTIEVLMRSKQVVAPDEIIGKLVDVAVEVASQRDDSEEVYRTWNGLVTGLAEGPAITRGFRQYKLTVRPQIWLLSQKSDCRIWQNQTAIDVLNTLLREHGLPAAHTAGVIGEIPEQEYSVQWNETDLAYLCRRLEEDGLFYFFHHEPGLHRLHVANHTVGWLGPSEAAQGQTRTKIAMGSTDQNHISQWMRNYSYIPGVRAGADFNFETPRLDIRATTPSLVSLPGNARSELYEYPSRVDTLAAADRAKRLRMQAAETDHDIVAGESNIRILETGRKFTPYEESNPDAEYDEHVIISARHVIVDRSYETNSDGPEYVNTFDAAPADAPLTPHRSTARPRIDGTQVGIIAGPTDEEIHIDKYGRIKLWWPWDRRAERDGSDTKWIQVAQATAGGTWGFSVHPRVGMQALCAFENGDPDRPYVLALVTNPDNMSAYELPANKTRTVIRSDTYKGTGFNEYSTEDAPGRENQFLHAQKDRTERVLNNRTKRVDNDEIANVGGSRCVEVGINQKTDIGGSMNTVVGGVGPMASKAMQGVQAISGLTSGLVSQALSMCSQSGSHVEDFTTQFATSQMGCHTSEGLKAREDVVNGHNPRCDQGVQLAAAGAVIGFDCTKLFPFGGIMNTVVSAFQCTSVGIGQVNQVGVFNVNNVGVASLEQVGVTKNTSVGVQYGINVGALMTIMAGASIKLMCGASSFSMDAAGNISISGCNLELSSSGPVKINGCVIDLNS